MKRETIRAVDAGMKDVDIIVEINDKDVVVTTPFEKIFIPRKEFEKLMSAEKKEVKVEPVVEEVEKPWRKDKHNA
jgi:hypothetical protein